MLSNAYFLTKFRFDTAENEPAKKFAKFCQFCQVQPLQRDPLRGLRAVFGHAPRGPAGHAPRGGRPAGAHGLRGDRLRQHLCLF